MKVLLDNGAPRGLERMLEGHTIREARAEGWDGLSNGALLQAAEHAGFDVLLTTDQNIRHQQNLKGRKIAVVVLGKARWRLIRPMATQIAAAISSAKPGSFAFIDVPGR